MSNNPCMHSVDPQVAANAGLLAKQERDERYERLAKVAVAMLEEIRKCEDEGSWWHNGDSFEKQLKQLGVVIGE